MDKLEFSNCKQSWLLVRWTCWHEAKSGTEFMLIDVLDMPLRIERKKEKFREHRNSSE